MMDWKEWENMKDFKTLSDEEIAWENLSDPERTNVERGMLYYSQTYKCWTMRPKVKDRDHGPM